MGCGKSVDKDTSDATKIKKKEEESSEEEEEESSSE